jgi:hypothetical protein
MIMSSVPFCPMTAGFCLPELNKAAQSPRRPFHTSTQNEKNHGRTETVRPWSRSGRLALRLQTLTPGGRPKKAVPEGKAEKAGEISTHPVTPIATQLSPMKVSSRINEKWQE